MTTQGGRATASVSAVGTPAAAITSFAKLFDPSILAAARPGPKTGDAVAAERVGDARDERRLGPDHGEVGVEAAGEAEQRLGVVCPHRVAVAERRDARIARRGVQPGQAGRLRQLPRERMLATARPDEEHLHGGRVYSASSCDAIRLAGPA